MPGGYSPDAQIRPTTAAEVLSAVVTKIRSHVTELNEESVCFITDEQEPSIEVQDNLFATVCMTDGHFDQQEIDGGGNILVVELTTIVVTIFSRLERDELERYEQGLLDPQSGLYPLKRLILKALAGKNLEGGQHNGAGSVLLMDALFPRTSRLGNKSSRGGDDDLGSISISFDAKFTWDLGEDSAQT